jgi:cardiolipin synthase
MSKVAITSYWSSELVFGDAGAYFDELINCLESATQTINLDFYIFRYDELGKRVIEALKAASIRGVTTRIIVDGIGSGRSANIVASVLSRSGIKVKVFRPLPWYLSHYQWSLKKGNWIEKMSYFFVSLNRRDHRKLCTIDSEIAFCGSLNIAQYHIDSGLNQDCWHDYGVKLEGENVELLESDFLLFWTLHERASNRQKLSSLLSNASPIKRKARNKFVINMIASARKHIWICTAYFSPTSSILKALMAARTRGIEVRLIVAEKSDVFFFPLLTATYYSDLLKMGVRVYAYQKGILHAKLMLIDEQCIIGSSNLNHRSYYHDLELDVVINTNSAIDNINTYLSRDIEDSREIVLPNILGINRIRLLGWLPRIFRYWS